MNHTLYPEILLPVTAHIASLVLAGATCMGYINFNENLLQLQLQLQLIIEHPTQIRERSLFMGGGWCFAISIFTKNSKYIPDSKS